MWTYSKRKTRKIERRDGRATLVGVVPIDERADRPGLRAELG